MSLDYSPVPAAPAAPVAPAPPPGPPLVPGNYGAPPVAAAPVAPPAAPYQATPVPPAPAPQGGASAGPAPSAPAAAPAPVAPADPTQLQLAQARAELARMTAQLQSQAQLVQLGQQAAQAKWSPAPAVPQTPSNPFGVPTFDLSLRQYIGEDANGQLVELPGAPFGTLNAFKAYQAAMPVGINKLLTDPKGTLAPVLQDMVREEAAKIADSRLAARDREQTVNQIFAEIEPWAIAKGADGKQVLAVNPNTGQYEPQFTPLGEVFSRAAHEASQFGLTDPHAIRKYAMAHVDAVRARVPVQQPTAPVGTVAQQLGVHPSHVPAPAMTVAPVQLPAVTGERPKMRDYIRQQLAVDGTYRPAA